MAQSGRLRRLVDARAALVVFGITLLAAIPLILSWGNKWWFWADDWDFLAARTGGNFGDLFRAHYQHWTTLPILAYRVLWSVVGIRSYVPYQLLIILLHLTAVALLRTIMRRAGVGPWWATLVAGVFVFFGAGAENIVIAFQITFVGSIVFGLTQLLLADHDGAFRRRDYFGVAAGLAALMCSGVGVAMLLVVGIAVLMRRGWRIALLHTVPLAGAYLLWSAVSPKGQSAGSYGSQTPVQVIKFVFIGAGSALGRLSQLPGLGIVLALVLIVGLAVAISRAGRDDVRTRYSVPLALLLGSLVFLTVTGLARSGQHAEIAGKLGTGPERARLSRYVYVVAAMALPAIAIAVDAIARRWRLLTIPLVVLLLAGVPGNVHQLRTYTNLSSIRRAQLRVQILEAPRLPLARKLPRVLNPAPFYGLTLGWLIDSVPSGRIPSPPRLSAHEIATQTISLALRPAKTATSENCRLLQHTEAKVLHVFQRLTLETGSAAIRYVPQPGVRSAPIPFVGGTTLIAVTGPLPIEITPTLAPARLCG